MNYYKKTIQHTKKQSFPTPIGTCFIKQDAPFADGRYPILGNFNAFMVIKDNDNFVECVMIEPIFITENGKPIDDKRWKLKKYDDFIELQETHPPFNAKSECRRGYKASDIFAFSKKDLFKDKKLEILADGGLTVTDWEKENAISSVHTFSCDKNARYIDVSGIFEDDDNDNFENEEYQNKNDDLEK